MPKPKVLILTGAVPYPLVTGAKIRTFNLMKALAAECDIELLTVITSPADEALVCPIEEAGIRCHLLQHKRLSSRMGKGIDAALSFISSEPYLTRHYTFPAYRRRLDCLLAEKSYDVIHCDSISMSDNLTGLDKKSLILTEHNIEQMIWAGYVEHARGALTRIYRQNQYHKVKRLEDNLNKFYDHVVTVSEADKRKLARCFPAERIVVVDNGVDPATYAADRPADSRSGVVFTGSLDWHPNIDGLTYFAREIFQPLRRHHPEGAITIVGRHPGAALKNLLSGLPGVGLRADVPEIQPFLRAARVMIVPLRIGGGSRLKILEAMASGLPVVSTSKGAEGLAVVDGESIIIRDDPVAFAAAVAELLENDDLWNRLARRGRELVQARYSWRQVARPLAELWRKVADA